jgi:hypothetical protein
VNGKQVAGDIGKGLGIIGIGFLGVLKQAFTNNGYITLGPVIIFSICVGLSPSMLIVDGVRGGLYKQKPGSILMNLKKIPVTTGSSIVKNDSLNTMKDTLNTNNDSLNAIK